MSDMQTMRKVFSLISRKIFGHRPSINLKPKVYDKGLFMRNVYFYGGVLGVVVFTTAFLQTLDHPTPEAVVKIDYEAREQRQLALKEARARNWGTPETESRVFTTPKYLAEYDFTVIERYDLDKLVSACNNNSRKRVNLVFDFHKNIRSDFDGALILKCGTDRFDFAYDEDSKITTYMFEDLKSLYVIDPKNRKDSQ